MVVLLLPLAKGWRSSARLLGLLALGCGVLFVGSCCCSGNAAEAALLQPVSVRVAAERVVAVAA